MYHITPLYRKIILFAFLFFFMMQTASAQDSLQGKTVIYSFLFNKVPPRFAFPLIGFVNIAEGDQHHAQIGFSNLNERNLHGTQIGFVNAIGGNCKGAQIGFVNLCKDSLNGAQIGYVNITGSKADGAQIGFVNIGKDSISGTQIGFVNTAGSSLKGTQIGFVNMTSGKIHGPQIGFINIADSMSGGVPLGFISILNKGGYMAIEAGVSEFYPVNASFKIGVKKLYTAFTLSCNPTYKNPMAWGAGLGSVLPMGRRFYFNPEILTQSSIEKRSQQFTSLSAQVGVNIFPKLSLVAGPSFGWLHRGRGNRELYKPEFAVYDHRIDAQNRLATGVRVSVRYRIK